MKKVESLYGNPGIVAEHWAEKTFEHPSGIARRIALEHIRGMVRGDSDILDLGCGAGAPSVAIADMVPRGTVIGVDSSQSMLDAALRVTRENLHFIFGDITSLPFPNEGFDLATSFMVLHNLPRESVEMVFRETSRVLRSAGRAVFLTIHPDFLNGDFDMDCMKYDPADLLRYATTPLAEREGIELWGQAMNFDGTTKGIMMIYHDRDTIVHAALCNGLELKTEIPVALTTTQLRAMYGSDAVRQAPSQPMFWILDLQKM